MLPKPKTYLVTGAAGFIGSSLCTVLLGQKNTKVIGIDDFTPYYPLKIKKRRIKKLLENKRFGFYQASIDNVVVLKKILTAHGPEFIIHTAARVGVRNGEINPVDYLKTNTFGSAVLLETAGKYMRHMVLFSSSSVYGNTAPPFRENGECRPLSVYGLSKYQMELYAQSYFTRFRVPITVVRPFSIYGPDGRPDMLPMKLLVSALKHQTMFITSGDTQRDWTYIDDLVRAVLEIVSHPKKYSLVNIGHGSPIPNREVIRVARKVLRKYGYELNIRYTTTSPVEMTATWANIDRLKKDYGRTPDTDFVSGFEKTAEFFFSHQNLYL